MSSNPGLSWWLLRATVDIVPGPVAGALGCLELADLPANSDGVDLDVVVPTSGGSVGEVVRACHAMEGSAAGVAPSAGRLKAAFHRSAFLTRPASVSHGDSAVLLREDRSRERSASVFRAFTWVPAPDASTLTRRFVPILLGGVSAAESGIGDTAR